MNLRLLAASAWMPGAMKRKRLRDLLRRCADAFGVPVPDAAGMSYGECLHAFAAFTAAQAEAVYAGDLATRSSVPTAAVRARLRATALELGQQIARTLRIGTRADAMKAAQVVYRLLGIDFEGRAGESSGTIVIRSC